MSEMSHRHQLIFFISLIASIFFSSCNCNIIPEDLDDVRVVTFPLKIRDHEFRISFPATSDGIQPDFVAADTMAEKFCNEKGPEFDIDEENFHSACFEPFSKYFRERAKKHTTMIIDRDNAKKSSPSEEQSAVQIEVSFTFKDLKHTVKVRPWIDSAMDVGQRFCSENRLTLQLDVKDYTQCVNTVKDKVNAAVTKELTIKSDGSSGKDVPNRGDLDALELKKEIFRQKSEKARMKRIHDSEQRRLQTSGARTSRSQSVSSTTARIKLEIGGEFFDVSFDVAIDTPLSVAKRFCEDKGTKLGVAISDMQRVCVDPILTHLEEAFRKARSGT